MIWDGLFPAFEAAHLLDMRDGNAVIHQALLVLDCSIGKSGKLCVHRRADDCNLIAPGNHF